MTANVELKTVTIPAFSEHAGLYGMKCTVEWVCPKCGGPRGEITNAISMDGKHSLDCDSWDNPCGHVDYYDDVREEAFALVKKYKNIPTMHLATNNQVSTDSQQLNDDESIVNAVLTVVLIMLFLFVCWGVKTQCPDTAVYTYCSKESR